MEEELVSSKRRKGPVLLGLFLQPHIAVYPKNKPPPPAKFLHCSEEGKDLQEGEWGSLDASLSFLNMPRKHIMGSSNGLLLCCADFFKENLHYVVCNPVTREFNVIPQPDKVYKRVTVTFICKRNNDHASLDRINYEILRVGRPPKPLTLSTTYEIDTFSSLNGEWKRSHLVSSLPFGLEMANVPGFVVDDVIYWRDLREYLVIYDRSKAKDEENIQLLQLPKDGETYPSSSELGLCEGNIHYARIDKTYLELWVLSGGYKSSSSAEWVLKHKVSLTVINPNTPIWDGSWILLGQLHPCNSNLIFLEAYNDYYWYDFESRKLHQVGCRHTLCDNFLYEWPCVPIITTGCQWLSRL